MLRDVSLETHERTLPYTLLHERGLPTISGFFSQLGQAGRRLGVGLGGGGGGHNQGSPWPQGLQGSQPFWPAEARWQLGLWKWPFRTALLSSEASVSPSPHGGQTCCYGRRGDNP